jgi:hypothetical protein
MAGKGFGLPLLEIFGRQVLLARGDGPEETERVAHVSVAVAPELIGNRPSASGGNPNSAAKSSANISKESPMRTSTCMSLPPGPGERAISTALNARWRKSIHSK